MALLVISSSRSCACNVSRKYGESVRPSVNSNGNRPMVDSSQRLGGGSKVLQILLVKGQIKIGCVRACVSVCLCVTVTNFQTTKY